MRISKNILMATVFFLSFLGVLFSSEKTSVSREKLIWQVRLSEQTDKNIWLDLKAHKEENSKPAKGLLHLHPNDGTTGIHIELAYLQVDGNYAWFAGRCVRDKNEGELVGRWFFLVAHDGGAPGRLADHLWCEWLPATKDAEQTAKQKVKNLEKPKENKTIEAGNIVVDSYDEIKDVERL